jgi:hypothetical protein
VSCHYEKAILKERKWFILFCLLSFLFPIFALTEIFKPINESLGVWFQRSGATCVVFAIFAEFKAVKMSKVLDPSGFVSTSYDTAVKKYHFQVQAFNYIAIFLVVFGTFVWGYGDIPLNQI